GGVGAGRAGPEAEWRPLEGTWSFEGGALRAHGGKPARIRLGRPVPGDIRVEFTAALAPRGRRGASDLSVELAATGLTGEADGYFFGFGSDGNTLSKVLRRGRRVAVAEGEGATIVPGKDHRVLVERAGGELRLE